MSDHEDTVLFSDWFDTQIAHTQPISLTNSKTIIDRSPLFLVVHTYLALQTQTYFMHVCVCKNSVAAAVRLHRPVLQPSPPPLRSRRSRPSNPPAVAWAVLRPLPVNPM